MAYDFTTSEIDLAQRVGNSCVLDAAGTHDIDFWHLTQETLMRLRGLIL
jgi:hypothetical protein